MVSFFGEVVFPSSRAFWDDDDEDGPTESIESQYDLFVRWIKEKPTRIKTLLVLQGDLLIDFTRKCLCPDSEELCVVEDDKQKRVSVIYQVNEDVYLCMISPRFNEKFSGKFVQRISDFISSAEQTISLTYCHVSQFKSTDIPDKPSFLRMLSTKRGQDVCVLKETLLERPNIVHGVTAGVLSYAEFMGLPSILYIFYVDSPQLDSLSAEPLLKLFTAMNCTVHDVTFSEEKFFNKGNLYM